MLSMLVNNDIESELSYAYLHAVASAAGAVCCLSNRLADNRGIDATLTSWGPFTNPGERIEVDVKIQLKATVKPPTDLGTHFSYFLEDVGGYHDLRKKGAYASPRILVVLYLPKEKVKWLSASPAELILKNGAYWVSLVGAPDTKNTSGVTVYLPKTQILTTASLQSLFSDLSRGNVPEYQDPNSK